MKNVKLEKKSENVFTKKEILKEIEKDLNLKERIIVHINKKIFIKVYHKTRIETINKLMQF